MQNKTAIIVGGGAAGFFCAVNAARMNPQLQVILLEKTGKLLSKVKVSGGGRCNVTHACFDITDMSKRYPRGKHFVRKAFHQFFTNNTIEWFQQRGVALKTESDGRMFPGTNSSETIINCLQHEAQRFSVDIKLNSPVSQVQWVEDYWLVEREDGKILKADYVCIATGGFPKAYMFQWLQQLGHHINPPVPSLFTFNLRDASGNKNLITALMGISVPHVRVKIAHTKLVEEGPLLITHWGLSGPAVLRLSAWGARELQKLAYNFSVRINWLPLHTEVELKQQFSDYKRVAATKKIINHHFENMPARLWQFLLSQSGVREDARFGDLSAKEENLLIRNLLHYEADVRGKSTFKEEFVTAGGIDLKEVDPHTMMSKLAPNLFFAGEVLDVDGITGGYNFQHAWTSGWIAAKHIAHLSLGS